jgi:adenine phosphoribosyltransferase
VADNSLDDRVTGLIGTVPDWPVDGVTFTDASRIWERHPDVFGALVDRLCEHCEAIQPSVLLTIEARAFLFAGAIAYNTGIRVVMARKGPRLPREVVTQEFGSGYERGLIMGAHRDAVGPEDRVLVLDDVLAAGWSAVGAVRLAEKMGARCTGVAVAIELDHLKGRQNLTEWTGAPLFAAARTPRTPVPAWS